MILLLGSTSYVGQAFARALRRRADPFIPLSRDAFDYSRFEFLFDYVRKVRPELVINAEDHTGMTECSNAEGGGQDNETTGQRDYGIREMEWWSDGEEEEDGEKQKGGGREEGGVMECEEGQMRAEVGRLEMLNANSLLPQTIARVCGMTNTPWGHVTSGSIYTGAKVFDQRTLRVEKDLSCSAVRRLFEAHPERFCGFTELDEPNFSFRRPPCTFYSGTKALAEELVRNESQSYIWRLRLPYNQHDDRRNLLWRLQDGLQLCDAVNSLSHLDECVGACLNLWERHRPFGIYNVVNPGVVSTHEILQMIQRILKPPRQFQLLVYESEPRAASARTSPPDCILDVSKLLSTGVTLRDVRESLERSLRKWERQPSSLRTFA
jgi:UDP-glucose 4,6-dehydratase